MVELTNKELMDTDGGFAFLPIVIAVGAITMLKGCSKEQGKDRNRKKK